MRQLQRTLQLTTEPKWLTEFTSQVQQIVEESRITTGLCTLFCSHTSASLLIQENADPTVRRDLAAFMSHLVPEHGHYRHGMEGPDDMPAHIRTTLTSVSETVPIVDGRLALGAWQGLYLWEHRQQSHTRQVLVHLIGE